jgi:hypothetical protein
LLTEPSAALASAGLTAIEPRHGAGLIGGISTYLYSMKIKLDSVKEYGENPRDLFGR